MHNEVMSIGDSRGLGDFLRTPTCRAEGDVVPHTEGKQRAILHHNADLGTKGLYRVRADIPAINQNSAFLGS